MPKQKYYVVWQGKTPGIYASWDSCKAEVFGFAGAVYKSYKSLAEAEAAFDTAPPDMRPQKKKEKKQHSDLTDLFLDIHDNPNIDKEAIVVDAACSGNPGVVEYRGLYLKSMEELFHPEAFPLGTNNLGEFLAIVHALCYLKEKKSLATIYTDSAIAMGWVKRKVVKTTLERNKKSEPIWSQVDKALSWLEKSSYPNKILKWDTNNWGEIPADFGRK